MKISVIDKRLIAFLLSNVKRLFEPYYAAKIPSSILNTGADQLTDEQKALDNVMYGDYMIDKVLGYCLSYQGISKGRKSE